MYCLDEAFEYEKCPVKILIYTHEMKDFAPRHWHRNFELNYIISGIWQVEVSGSSRRAGPGEFVCINSQEEHQLIPLCEQQAEKIMVIFDTDLMEDCHFNDDTQKISIDEKVHNTERIKQLMLKLFKIYNQKLQSDQAKKIYVFKIPYEYLQVMGIVYDLLYELLKYFVKPKEQSRKTDRAQEKMRAAEKYIAMHYMENLSLGEIAELLGITREHCARLFKKWTNLTFKEYLSRTRIFRAYPLIRDTDKSMVEISRLVGFPNVRAFNKSFLEGFGIKPCELRQKYENINILHEI